MPIMTYQNIDEKVNCFFLKLGWHEPNVNREGVETFLGVTCLLQYEFRNGDSQASKAKVI